MACGDYFRRGEGDVEEWTFQSAPDDVRRASRPFRIPRFMRTLSEWMNAALDAGFAIDRFDEPYADDAAVARLPQLADTRLVAYFLIVRARKPRR